MLEDEMTKKINRIDTPIVVIIFNRPDLTEILFNRLRKIKIRKLYVVVDGPRVNNITDSINRSKVLEQAEKINFAEQVFYNVSEKNLGCKYRVSSGLDWVFEHEEEAIILEDDCIPQIDFLIFAELMLNKYRNDERIGIISGTNATSELNSGSTYFYSRYANIWGWATWKRIWSQYDVEMNDWVDPKVAENVVRRIGDKGEQKFWRACFDQTYRGLIDTWDYQLWFSLWKNSRLSVVPSVNLIENLGFAHPLATHTGSKHPFSETPTGQLVFPLILQNSIIPDVEMDIKIRKKLYNFPSLHLRLANKLKRLFIK